MTWVLFCGYVETLERVHTQLSGRLVRCSAYMGALS